MWCTTILNVLEIEDNCYTNRIFDNVLTIGPKYRYPVFVPQSVKIHDSLAISFLSLMPL